MTTKTGPTIKQLRADLAKVTREREAYKKAKQENDDRFMIERDEARAELARVTAERDEMRTVFNALPRCVFAACDNVATWKLDDFSVGCDAHHEASVKGSPWLASHPELPYAKALRAMLAKKATK